MRGDNKAGHHGIQCSLDVLVTNGVEMRVATYSVGRACWQISSTQGCGMDKRGEKERYRKTTITQRAK